MTTLIFDIESNAVRDFSDIKRSVSVVHVISILEYVPEGPRKLPESFSDTPLEGTIGSIEQGLQRLTEASTIVGHNIINFDLPVLKTLYNWEPKENVKIYDTLVVSRLINPDRGKPTGYTGKGGPHSLEAWGYRGGTAKPDHEDWSVFDSAMLRRNRADVEINDFVYRELKNEMRGHDWSEAINLELEVARIISKQEQTGVNFDVRLANELLDGLDLRIKHIDSKLFDNCPVSLVPLGAPILKPFKTNGDLVKRVVDYFQDHSIDACGLVAGPFTRLKQVPLNLNSHSQLKEYLYKHGWEPTEWNYIDGERSSPKLTEDSLDSVTGDIGRLIKERIAVNHRKSQIQGWIERLRDDSRISAGANTCGTNTGRLRHTTVVNVPKASPDVFLGKEMRSLFTATGDRDFIGHDADGLELRMLAHYMNDEGFTQAVVSGKKEDGTDIHTVNQRLAGLPNRDAAKTFIYAFLYGAGDAKLGTIVGGDASDGARLRRRFLKNLPALDNLITRVKKAAKKGWLRGLDNRKIFMRSDANGRIMDHKALNTLLQSAGAVVMKKSMVILDQAVTSENLDVWKVIDMHDEAQADVNPKDSKKYMELAELSVVQAGEHFKLRVPLKASSDKGKNWAETH